MSTRATYIKWLAEKTGNTELQKEATVIPKKPDSEVSAQNYEYDAAEEPYVPVGLHGVMATTERLLAVNKGLADTDFRDSQYFKKHFEPDRQIWERIRTDTGNSRKKLLRMVAARKNLSALVPFYFDDYTEKHITSNPLCSPLEEINPVHLQENQRRITGMGPGGIQSEDSITDSMNSVHPSQFGFIDPVAGPESSKAGVDVRMTWGAKMGSNGRIYQIFKNRRTGKNEWKSPHELDGMNIKLPD